jgi:hypothetical protein
MPYLLRQARVSAWSGEPTVTDERRRQAHASFERRAEDTDGISVYRVEDESHALLVVATLACAKMEDGKLDLLFLEDAEVTRFGPVRPILGTTPVRSANPLHGVLDWESALLVQLVESLLAACRKSRRYQTRDVRAAVVALDADDIEWGEHRDWVLQMKADHAPSGS